MSDKHGMALVIELGKKGKGSKGSMSDSSYGDDSGDEKDAEDMSEKELQLKVAEGFGEAVKSGDPERIWKSFKDMADACSADTDEDAGEGDEE